MSKTAAAARLLLLAGLTAAIACSGQEPQGKPGNPVAAAQPGGPLQRDTLVIATAQDPKDLLYLYSQSASDSPVIEALNLPPMDADFDCRMTFDPALAASWQFGDDGKSITLHLRDGVTWEDGHPVTAEDYRFTYDRVADPAVASARADVVARMVPGARPRVVDAHTVTFEFTEPYDRVAMLQHVNLPLLPKHVLDNAAVDGATLRAHALNTNAPLSNGPWRLAAWEKNTRLVLEPNPKFTGPASYIPRLKRVIFKVIPEYADRVAALAAGSVDLVDQLLVADADMLASEHPEVQLRRRGWRTMDTVMWNTVDAADHARRAAGLRPGEHPTDAAPNRIFGDRDVRRALASAIDVDKLIKDLLTSPVTGEVYGRPAIGTITPALCGAHADDIQRFPFDPAATRTQLAALGWTDSNGDGWLDKDGQPMRFTMLTNAGNQRRARAATLIQANLKDVGIDMQIEQLESNTFFERLRARDYDAALSGWAAGLNVDAAAIWGADSEFNFTSYRSARVDELLARGAAEPDADRAKPIWQDLQRTIYDDQPYAFLYWMDEVVGVNDRFQNTAIDITSPYRRLYQWSVPVDKVKYTE